MYFNSVALALELIQDSTFNDRPTTTDDRSTMMTRSQILIFHLYSSQRSALRVALCAYKLGSIILSSGTYYLVTS